MRMLFYLVGAACLAAGLLFGALNASIVTVDLYVVQFEMMLGVALLTAMLLGATLGWVLLGLGVILPLRRQVARGRRAGSSSSAMSSVVETA